MVIRIQRMQRDTGLDENHTPTDLVHARQQREDVGRVEVIQQSQAQHHVELAVPLEPQISHVFEQQLEVVELERILRQPQLLEAGSSALDRNDARTPASELDGEETFERSQIEDPESVDRTREVRHHLDDAAQTRLVPAGDTRTDRVQVVAKLK